MKRLTLVISWGLFVFSGIAGYFRDYDRASYYLLLAIWIHCGAITE